MIKPEARTLIAATGADFRIGGARAFYNPSADFVQVPPPQAYFEPPSMRSATGPAMRPASTATIRDHFGSKSYARRELVAELAGGLRLRVNRYRANRSSCRLYRLLAGLEERQAQDIQRSVSRAARGGFPVRLAAERYRAVQRSLIG
jgi:antirestriction protein ArdC